MLGDLAYDERKAMAEVADPYPQKRLIQPEETASLVVFLCRDEALGITAENIRVSAGSLW